MMSSLPGPPLCLYGGLTFTCLTAGGGGLHWPALLAWSKFISPLRSLSMRGKKDLEQSKLGKYKKVQQRSKKHSCFWK